MSYPNRPLENADDAELVQRIDALVEEEHRLERDHAAEGLDASGRGRLEQLEVQLDQAWDLLRQRRAREELGENPDDAKERPIDEVESYLQ
jgi:hypothetical protein